MPFFMAAKTVAQIADEKKPHQQAVRFFDSNRINDRGGTCCQHQRLHHHHGVADDQYGRQMYGS